MKSLARCILILLTLQAAPHAFGKNAARLASISAPASVSAPQSSQPPASTPDAAAPVAPPQTSERKVTAYTLPPDLYRKARDLGRFHARFAWIDFFYGIFVLWVILSWKFGPQFRDWAESVSRNRFIQAAAFAPLLLGIILVAILYAVIRSSPRRWWFYFWLVSLPIAVILVFIQPLIVDPMFHKFEPLQLKDPALTASLETMVQRAGVNIPPARMFWMGAGEKTTELNAYVTGIGASKRIVVWDTTIAKMNTPQIVLVAGHETGHYVLNHIWKGLLFAAVFLFVLFYLGHRTIGWLLRRFGTAWGIRGVDDWASLPALLLLLSVYSFVANPVQSAVSRYFEHQADQYGLEVTHGLTPDSSQVAAQAFQVLGEVDLSDPTPSPITVFMFYSHPTIPDRIRFSLTYDPWDKGEQPEFVK